MRQTDRDAAAYVQASVSVIVAEPLLRAPAGAPAVSAAERVPKRAGRAERRLAQKLRQADPAALETIYEAHGSMVFGYLRQALGDAGEAEDVFQQVMTEVWRRGADYDPARASLATWIMMIARSRAVDALRRRRPEPQDPASLQDLDVVESETEALAERWRVAALLEQIEPGDRDLLRLRFFDGLSQTEIAARTGIPLGTIKSRMVRGLERLHDLVVEQEAGEARLRRRGHLPPDASTSGVAA
jgi:RNA polymerase sigma-70 factor (ECF subfamily)